MLGGLSFGHLLVVAIIVVLLFGTKKLRTLGSDLGASLKGFKKAMSDDDEAGKKNGQDADFNAQVTHNPPQGTDVKDETKKDKEQV
ncbi:Sec-independent protein translocase TatA [Erwinia sp. OLTSP20]|uniref:twin-arginine translocase subunit TatE n=1 Tax=unclassified Erwinia TaxID=2622719 RepID=UPI000C17E073|nr:MULTISPECIES: twin-arginine translocase subunit TatE [unclassified Erwinia]PIJ50829.1 Sec-independent protein translocase TatA [Erwinia sp. OAMSP11]PIJ72975.1 Sec-independent protein translocase TatA [Erwinia sp. OLSSP12]PIJ81996.1 Sec-independent protein translocase TatA [Erwinia sp. OLCASP19]PIJ84651.1 Sec-independent protein translocase TatA [Erwinia sp. OLMTSP26]PIJ86976.1 Sec-independent protein translocase TatA [Erwinia sp. OLMDSP33]